MCLIELNFASNDISYNESKVYINIYIKMANQKIAWSGSWLNSSIFYVINMSLETVFSDSSICHTYHLYLNLLSDLQIMKEFLIVFVVAFVCGGVICRTFLFHWTKKKRRISWNHQVLQLISLICSNTSARVILIFNIFILPY